MSDWRKKLLEFLSGKENKEGRALFESWYRSFDEKDKSEAAAQEPDEDRLREELTRIKRGTKSIPLPVQKTTAVYWKAAAAVLLVAIAGAVLYSKMGSLLHPEIAMIERESPRGERLQLTLPDGSNVWLNAATHFRYPARWDGPTRDVYLEGEAYFEVTHNERMPFIIHSGNMRTQVLGTTFNIQAYGDDAFYEVAVLTGKVSVSEETTAVKKLSILTPGQKIVLEKATGTYGVASFDNPDQYTAWRDGKLVFENASVQSIVRSLSRAFDADIKLRHESLGTCLITTSFDPMTLPEILELLCLTLNTRYTQEGPIYWIEGAQCDGV